METFLSKKPQPTTIKNSRKHFNELLSEGLDKNQSQMAIFELDELFVEVLYCEDIRKAARILRSNQQPVVDNVSREWFKTGDDKLNQNLS